MNKMDTIFGDKRWVKYNELWVKGILVVCGSLVADSVLEPLSVDAWGSMGTLFGNMDGRMLY